MVDCVVRNGLGRRQTYSGRVAKADQAGENSHSGNNLCKEFLLSKHNNLCKNTGCRNYL